MDADALIKLTRAGAKELLVETFEVFIPAEVEREVVQEGSRLGHPDAVVVAKNLDQGKLQITGATAETVPIGFSDGDRAIARHALSGGYAAVVTDDAWLLERLKAHGVSVTVPAAILLAIGRKRKLPAPEVLKLLESLRPYVSPEEFVTFRLIVEGKYPRK